MGAQDAIVWKCTRETVHVGDGGESIWGDVRFSGDEKARSKKEET